MEILLGYSRDTTDRRSINLMTHSERVKHPLWYANSLLYWYPKVVEAGARTPTTKWIEMDEGLSCSVLDGVKESINYLRDRLVPIAEEIKYPLFMRTDLSAAKHHWEETCFVKDRLSLMSNVCALVDHNMSHDLEPKAIVLREFLDLESKFKAFKGIPIAREFRFFAKGGKILCHHPYWPENSILFWGIEEPTDWRASLRSLAEIPKDFDEAKKQVVLASSWATSEYWSIDVCKCSDGKWYVTDMAKGIDSYHDESCNGNKVIWEEGVSVIKTSRRKRR